MKKTLSLLLALVMVIGLFPVFADEAPALTAEEAGAVLQGYGAIKGDSNGDLMIDKELKRQDAVVILTRLMGKDKEVEAMPKETKASFEDITIDYYQPFLAFAESNKWIEGKAEKKFGFNDVVTVKEFSAMLLRALGHDTMGENYAKVMDLAKEQGLFKGAMVEENANLVRGIAFILMNNTLETAPKGEDKALVYKLGYKEEPKPENLTVVSAEAAGLKAIDVKFSKAVDEKSLASIKVKNDANKPVDFKAILLDEMTARLNLNKAANQDNKLMVVVADVKSADMMETAEKFEATIFMTDQVRPELLSVEALNPKTLVVKVSEPITLEKKSFTTLKEIQIEGKALVGKVYNEFKNEFTVELLTALKAGEHKVEVSSLKDYAGFVAKTAEFDVTVVEDKDAPVVVSATMETLDTVKVVFDEPLSVVGQFRVDSKDPKSVMLGKDKKTVTITLKENLGMGAITEVKVEYKGQKDIMANMVKEWTKFTFKVEDDTTLPEVKSVATDGKTLVVTFTKKMAVAGHYTIKKGSDVVVAKTAIKDTDFDKEDKAVLKLNVLPTADTTDYTLILEGLIDGSVRKNELAKYEASFTAKDTKAPEIVGGGYYKDTTTDGMLVAKIFFSEAMDEETLLDKKNYTFDKYDFDGDKKSTRADAAAVTLRAENDGKVLVIEATDKKVKSFSDPEAGAGRIKLVGLKDKADNPMATVEAKVATAVAQTATAHFIKQDGKFVIKIVFTQPIENMGIAYTLTGKGDKDLNLSLREPSTDNVTFYYTFDQDKVTSDAKHEKADLKLNLVNDGKDAMSIFNKPAEAIANIADEAAPMIAVDADGNKMIKLSDDSKKILITFDEVMKADGAAMSLVDDKGVAVATGAVTLAADTKVLELPKAGAGEFLNGNYKLTITNVKDDSDNIAKDLGTMDIKLAASIAKFTTVTAPDKDNQNTIVLNLDKDAKIEVADQAVVAGDFEVTFVNGGATKTRTVNKAVSGVKIITLTLDAGDAFAEGDKFTIKYKATSGKIVDKINTSSVVESFDFPEVAAVN